MSGVRQVADVRADSDAGARGRFRYRLVLAVSLVVTGWSVIESISLGLRHTVGAEVYGVLVAGLAVVAGGLTVGLLVSTSRRAGLSLVALALWGVVAIGGVAGTFAHIVGPPPGHGPIDARPRPMTAPLVFTVLGVAGAAALLVGGRAPAVRTRGS
jgi:hypothetical protein